MLVGNGHTVNRLPVKYIGGVSIAGLVGNFTQTGRKRNFSDGEATVFNGTSIADRYGLPAGYLHPYSWTLPQKAGGMATFVTVAGTGDGSSVNLAGGLNGTTDFSGSGTISNAEIQWLMQASSTVTSNGTFTADVVAFGNASSDLTGTSDVVSSIAALLAFTAGITASGTLASTLNAEANLSASALASGDISGAITATASIVSSLLGSGVVSSDLIAAVLLAADLSGSCTFTGLLVAALEAAASLSGSSSVTGDAVASLQALASLTGSGEITTAALAGAVQAVSALSGAGLVSADVAAMWDMVASVLGTAVYSGTVSAPAFPVAELTGNATVAATFYSLGFMSAAINVTGDVLTTANVADAIWRALATAYNEPGSMGNKLNSAASAGDPWSTALPGSYADGTAGHLIGNMGDTVWGTLIEAGFSADQILRLVAAVLLNKATGGGTTAITFRDMADAKNRVQMTVDNTGNRSNITVDPT